MIVDFIVVLPIPTVVDKAHLINPHDLVAITSELFLCKVYSTLECFITAHCTAENITSLLIVSKMKNIIKFE